jgi:hypothetical protein
MGCVGAGQLLVIGGPRDGTESRGISRAPDNYGHKVRSHVTKTWRLQHGRRADEMVSLIPDEVCYVLGYSSTATVTAGNVIVCCAESKSHMKASELLR